MTNSALNGTQVHEKEVGPNHRWTTESNYLFAVRMAEDETLKDFAGVRLD